MKTISNKLITIRVDEYQEVPNDIKKYLYNTVDQYLEVPNDIRKYLEEKNDN